jgi:hypothetical protein
MPMGHEIRKREPALPPWQIAFVHAHGPIVLGGNPASEVYARRHRQQSFRKGAAKGSQYITDHT